MGSVVGKATAGDDADAALLVQNAIDGTMGGPSRLEIYLRLLAANWARKQSPSRLVT